MGNGVSSLRFLYCLSELAQEDPMANARANQERPRCKLRWTLFNHGQIISYLKISDCNYTTITTTMNNTIVKSCIPVRECPALKSFPYSEWSSRSSLVWCFIIQMFFVYLCFSLSLVVADLWATSDKGGDSSKRPSVSVSYITVKPTKPWTPEIFMECYCVGRNKPIRCEITKPQTATVISLWRFACVSWTLLWLASTQSTFLKFFRCSRFSEFDSYWIFMC